MDNNKDEYHSIPPKAQNIVVKVIDFIVRRITWIVIIPLLYAASEIIFSEDGTISYYRLFVVLAFSIIFGRQLFRQRKENSDALRASLKGVKFKK